jgi:hypothetical protein
LAEKFAAVWEKKNTKAARAGGVSLMALSLAACGSDDDASGNDTSETGTVNPISSDLTNGSDSYVGTSGDDVVTAGAVYTPGGNDRINSLQDEDVLDGGAGDDTINITVTTANDNGNNIITPTMSNIENVNVNFANSGATDELDFQDVTGVVDLALTRISTDGTATIDNIQDVIATLALSDSGEDTDSIVISFDDEVLGGAADALAMSVNGVDVASLEVDGEDGEGYETINMAASGDLIADDFEIDGTETLNIAGAGDVTLGGFSVSNGHLATIDASGSTGDMDIELGDDNIVEARISGSSGADIDFTYTGSAGNDYIRVDDESLSAAPTGGDDDNGHDTIDGGAGDNTLDFTVDTTRDLIHNDVTVSNIQNVHIDATAAVTVDLDGQQFGEATGSADVDTITVRNNIAAAGVADFDLNDLDAGVLVRVQHSSADANDDVGDTDVYVHQADGTGTADTQTVEIISGTNTSETFDFTLDIQANDADAADVNDAEVESVTIIDSDTENNIVTLSSVAEHDGTLTLSGGRADDTFSINGNVIATTVDGRLQLSDVSLDLGAADQDIDMGSGDDNLYFQTIGGFTDDDNVVGGAGDDVLWAGYEADSDSDLNVSGVERINLDADGGTITVDVSESDDITTVGIVSNAHADNVTAGDETDIINLIADNISTIHFVGDTKAVDDYNGLTITDEDADNPATMVINVDASDDGESNIGVITLDSDTTSLTINNNNDHNDTNDVTEFTGLAAAGLTTLVVTDDLTDADGSAVEDTIIDLDDTVALTSVDASAAIGGLQINIEAMADNATINLLQADDNDDDAQDDLDITFVGDTGADNVTITGGDAVEEIRITNGDMDQLSITTADGADVINLKGMTGDNVEINAGAGADQVTGGTDEDEIDLGAADGDDDDVFLVNTNHDTITNFETDANDDALNFSTFQINTAAKADVAAGGTVADAADAITVYAFADGATASGGQTVADYNDMVDVLAFLNAALTIEGGDVDGIAVINDLTTDQAFVYYMDVDAVDDTAIEAASLIATVQVDDGAALVAANIVV